MPRKRKVERNKLILHMRYKKGKSLREIGEIFGIHLVTVRDVCKRELDRLKAKEH